jgi:hypothetical protein
MELFWGLMVGGMLTFQAENGPGEQGELADCSSRSQSESESKALL